MNISRLTVIFATLLAAALLLPTLGVRSFWLDEVLSLHMANDWAALRADSNMWFYHLLLRGWLLLGSDEWTVRLLSAVFAIAAVPLTALLGSALFGQKAAPYAALLMALNPLLQQYGAEARAYSLLLFLVVLASVCFVRILQRRGGAAWWVGFVLASAAAIYSHFFAVLVLGAQAAALLLAPRRSVPWVGFVLSALGIGLLLLPLALLAGFIESNTNWIPRPDPGDLLRVFEGLAGSRPLFFLYLGAALLGLWAAWRRRQFSVLDAYPWLWLLLPIAVAYGFSLLVKPIFVQRYLIICLPALVLVAAAGLASLQPRALSAGALLIMLALTIPVLAPGYKPSPGWRELSSHVAAHVARDDVVLFYVGFHAAPFEYYLRQADAHAPRVVRLKNDRDLQYRVGNARRVWLVLFFNERFQPGATANARRIERYLRSRYTQVDKQRFGPYRVLRFDVEDSVSPLGVWSSSRALPP